MNRSAQAKAFAGLKEEVERSSARRQRSGRRRTSSAIAGVLGLMVGVFGAFLVEYFEGWEVGR